MYLTRLDLDPTVKLGGVLFRAGHDPHRDVVAFCGPGNRGTTMCDGGMHGHVWLEVYGDYIDFSCDDWKRLFKADDGLGQVRWVCRPPSLIWAPADMFDWKPEGEPDLGEVWFCPWQGPPLDLRQRLTSISEDILTPEVCQTIKANIDNYSLPERLKDALWNPDTYDAKWRHRMRRRVVV